MALQTIEHKAPKKASLTLDEVAAFVEAARRAGASGRELVEGSISWGGKVQSLAVEVDESVSVVMDKQ